MSDINEVIKQCEEAIDTGKPIMFYSFYYDVLELLESQQAEIERLKAEKDKAYREGWNNCEKQQRNLNGGWA